MAGRRPKPSALKLVKGNPGRRRVNKKEPKPKQVRPKQPATLNADGKRAWKKLCELLENMGVLTEADGYALERLVECYAEVLECKSLIRKHGRTYETTNMQGDVMHRARPEVGQLADADKRFRGYLIEFGLTPAARSKVEISGDDPNDPLSKYFD